MCIQEGPREQHEGLEAVLGERIKRPASSSQSFQPKGGVVSSQLRARQHVGIPLTLMPTSRGGSPLCHHALLSTDLHRVHPQPAALTGFCPGEQRLAGQRVHVTLSVKVKGRWRRARGDPGRATQDTVSAVSSVQRPKHVTASHIWERG